MEKRHFSGEKLYKLLKTLVLLSTGVALIITVYTGVMSGFGTDILLNRWENYCSANPWNSEFVKVTGQTCMSSGLWQIDQFNDICWKALLVAILLPTSFFGGTALYRYLFPIKN